MKIGVTGWRVTSYPVWASPRRLLLSRSTESEHLPKYSRDPTQVAVVKSERRRDLAPATNMNNLEMELKVQ